MGNRAIKHVYGSVKKYRAAQEKAKKENRELPPLFWQKPKRDKWQPRHRVGG